MHVRVSSGDRLKAVRVFSETQICLCIIVARGMAVNLNRPHPYRRPTDNVRAIFKRVVQHSYTKHPHKIVIPKPPTLLPHTATPEMFKKLLEEAPSTCTAQNYVATFRSVSNDVLCGASPIPTTLHKYFTRTSVDGVERRRRAVIREVARMSQMPVELIESNHPEVVNMMRTGNISLYLHLPYIVSLLGGAAAVTANFSSGICWLRYPTATALIFSSGRVVMTGCTSSSGCRLAADTYIDILQRNLRDMPFQLYDFRVQNVVCSASTRFLVNLQKLATIWPTQVNLDM